MRSTTRNHPNFIHGSAYLCRFVGRLLHLCGHDSVSFSIFLWKYFFRAEKDDHLQYVDTCTPTTGTVFDPPNLQRLNWYLRSSQRVYYVLRTSFSSHAGLIPRNCYYCSTSKYKSTRYLEREENCRQWDNSRIINIWYWYIVYMYFFIIIYCLQFSAKASYQEVSVPGTTEYSSRRRSLQEVKKKRSGIQSNQIYKECYTH